MTEEGGEDAKARPEEVAAYIAVLSAEMARMARANKMPDLAYILDMARIEAAQHSPAQNRGEGKRIA